MLDRLNEALERIEDDPANPVDVAEMARIALTSEHHLRRMFSALAGMPLSEYVRRRRLTLAGTEVLEGKDTLLDIAARYGYGSAEAFTRAFCAVHGISPGQARRTRAALTSQSRLSFHLTIEGRSTVRYRIVDKDAFRLVGLRKRVPVVHEGLNPALVEFFESIDDATHELLEELSDQEPYGGLSATVVLGPGGGEGSDMDYYLAAATTAEAPEGMETLEVPASTWAVFPYERVRFPEGLQSLWREVYSAWFPSHPAYHTAEALSLVRAEYDEQDENISSGELWLPVAKAAE
ncbi:helix-turn-helix domain-containing protein [Streptomyces sp. MP131-18]|uniref:AraC family transcriptional regulator n=1 Tax=Streptomyces sp. MP131-18 TaxID=1857892 RepID=UPI00097CB74E|nr:helix-turn-helix domain-containing protein [Streptomyces sp. MP131-18]ONK10311.1 Multiple antibiotic resistance protein MarA [Streptomyces sp. MP131-18]